jgi:twitching motility protein PilT
MARLDPILDKLLSRPGASLLLETGAGAFLHAPGGAPVAVIQQPLTTQQIVGAFAEIAPPELQGGFPPAGRAVFAYAHRAGTVEVHFEHRDGKARVVVGRASGPAKPPPAADPVATLSAREELLAPAHGAPLAADEVEIAPPTAPPPPPRARPAAPAPRADAPRTDAPPASAPTSRTLPADPRAAMDALLQLMLDKRASDLHVSSECAPMLRIDGDMVPFPEYGALAPRQLKELLFSIAPERNRAEFDACSDTDFAHETPEARFRANLFADRKGPGAVFRQIPTKILSAEAMGLSQHILDLCYLSKGLVLVTGPTGSGKSTTLAAMIDHVNANREDHIITIEDPIEFVHPNKKCLVNQREVNVHTESFKRALRAALREDPDIVLVGELRDLETIAIAIETAETGHLVFGTLHTNTAPSTVDRIIDQFPPDRQEQIRMMLSESLKGVISQVLVKKIGGGRAAAQEVLLCTSSVANLIREGKTFQIPSIMQTAKGQGMVTLNDALLDLVKRKVVLPKDAYLKAVAKSEFKTALERSGFSLDADA